MRKYKRMITVAVTCVSLVAVASGKDIVSHIATACKGRVEVVAQASLLDRLKSENGNPENGAPQKAAVSKVGYRIQVFSDSNPTAKRDAQIKERNITARFPLLRSYITYKAPSWRLRVGDFATRTEAVEMLEQIREAIPSYGRELTVVVDKINRNAEE